MNIGINLLALLPKVSGGIEYYINNLIWSLQKNDHKNQYFLITNLDNHAFYEIKADNFHRIKINIHARPQFLRISFEQFVLPIISRKFNLAVLHSPSYTFPALSRVPGVVTICDMLYKIYPMEISKSKMIFWKILIPISVYRCQKVLTLSDDSKRDIIRYLQISDQKVVVTPLALDSGLANRSFVRSGEISEICNRYRIKRPFILTVGGLGMHKNQKILIKALHILHQKEETKNLSLVIAGRDYGYRAEVELEIIRLGVSEDVFLPGYIPEEDLPGLYSGAEVYVTPSLLEGFGLTVLEAMNFGTPVVISNRHSLPEVAGEAALMVDPTKAEEVAKAISRIVLDPKLREELVLAGFRRSKQFSWDRTAALTIAAYRAAARTECSARLNEKINN